MNVTCLWCDAGARNSSYVVYQQDGLRNLGFCKMLIYAEDAEFFVRVNNRGDSKTLQVDFDKIVNWCHLHCIKLSVGECKIMRFSSIKKCNSSPRNFYKNILSYLWAFRINHELYFFSSSNDIVLYTPLIFRYNHFKTFVSLKTFFHDQRTLSAKWNFLFESSPQRTRIFFCPNRIKTLSYDEYSTPTYRVLN